MVYCWEMVIDVECAFAQALAALWRIAWHGPDEVEAGDLEAPPSRAYLARNAALLALALPNLGHMLRVRPRLHRSFLMTRALYTQKVLIGLSISRSFLRYCIII